MCGSCHGRWAYRGGPIYGVSEQAIDILEHHINRTGGECGSDGAWEGARLLRQPVGDDDGGFYAPYLDPEPRRLTDNGKYLVIDCHGNIDANSYQGILGGESCRCSACNTGMSEDDSYYSEYRDEVFCSDCYYEDHFYCEYADGDYHINQSYKVYVFCNGSIGYCEERVSDWAVEYGDDFVFCDNDDEHWHIDLAYFCEHEDCYISQRGLDDGDYFISDWDSECYPDELKATTDTGETISIGEAEDDELELDKTDNIWKEKKEED